MRQADDPILPNLSQRLQRLLQVLFGLSLVMLVLTSYALIRSPIISIGIINSALFGYCGALLAALRLSFHGRTTLATSIMAYALCAMSLIDSIGDSASITVLLLLPVLAVVLALPYLQGRALNAVVVVASLTVAMQLWLASIAPLVSPIPNDLRVPFVVYVGELITISLILVMMARNHGDLRQVAKRFQAANKALHAAHATLEAQVAERTAKLHAQVVQLEEQTRHISLLKELGQGLHGSHTIAEAYDVVALVTPQLFAGTRGMITSHSPAEDVALVVASWGTPYTTPYTIPKDICLTTKTKQPYAVHTSSSIKCEHVAASTSHALCIPVVLNDEIRAVVHVEHIRTGEDEATIALRNSVERLAGAAAEQLTLALSNLMLRAELEHQVRHDPLTGVGNRRVLEEALVREVERAKRLEQIVTVIQLDIDHFKRYNDQHGHVQGDTLLRWIGNHLRRTVRSEDVVCRYGGEEFTLILPNISLEDALRRANDLCDSVRDCSNQDSRVLSAPITISLGVAAFPLHASTSTALVEAADAALYHAKANGRDRVACSQEYVVAPEVAG